jgi:hypothetical protein
MSTSGIYNYHPKVAHPNTVFPQMASDCHQPPFFFGGSQVPTNLGIATGSGIHTPYISHTEHARLMGVKGRGTSVSMRKNHKIYLTKNMPSIKK